MTIPIKLAHLCGPLGQALAVIGDETWLFENDARRRPTGNDIRFFFEHGLEVRTVDTSSVGNLTEDDLSTLLNLETDKHSALRGLLFGMDNEIDSNLRLKSMRLSDRLLSDPIVADFVERRFLKPLSQQAWDIAGALHLARVDKLSAVTRLYSLVKGPLLFRLEDEVALWAAEQVNTSLDRAIAVRKAYETGLVALIAMALVDNDQSQIRSRIFLAKNVGWDRRLAIRLVNRFAPASAPPHHAEAHLEEENDLAESAELDIVARVRARVVELLEEYSHRKLKKRRRPGVEAYQAALREVEWIAKRFESGRLDAAWADVADLAEQQFADGGPDKLAMSLTSLATHLVTRSDIALELCDLAAICAPDDPVIWDARAETLRALGRLDEALTAYDRAIKDFPQNAVARNGRAETLRALGRPDEALAGYERTIEGFPENSVARNGRAETLRSLGRLDEALAAYDRAIEDFPQNSVARNGRAETLRSLGRFDEALTAYDRTIEGFPQNSVARNGRAEALRSLHRFDEALAAYDCSIVDFPQDVYARNGRAETLRSLGRFDEALAAYDRSIEDFPRDVFVRTGRAETLRSLGRFDEALAAYDRTIESFPQNAVARTGRAETLRSLGRFDEALAAYDRTIEGFPQNAAARNGRAETLRSLGRFDEALAAYDRSVADFPQEVFVWTGRAETLRSLGRFDEALAAYDRTIESFPQNAAARNGRAETLRSLGRLDEALAAYDLAIDDFPQDVFVQSGRAETLRSLGRLDEALAAYDRAIEDFPQNAVARSGRAETLRSLGRLDEALAAYDRAIEDFPRDVFVRNGRAETLRSLDRLDEALAVYDRAIEDFPRDAFSRNARAVVLSDLERFNEARTSLRDIEQKPRTSTDWVAIHIICTIDLKERITPALAERLARFVEQCPFREQKFYFETTLAIVRIALNRMSDARQTLKSLARRPELKSSERVALQLMEAHAEAADGNVNAAVESLAAVSNVIPYENFRLRQIKREIERRFGLGAEPAITNPADIMVSNTRLVRLETDFWIEQANRRAA